MLSVNVYLNYNGNCKQAFDHYKSVFGGEFSHISTFGEMPPQEGMPPMPEEVKNNIMHVSLTIGDTVIMGSDTGGEWAPKLEVGNNFSVSVNTDNQEEAERIFNGLAEGGKITMPLNKTFWGAYFGMCTDAFGVNWMVNCELGNPEGN
jgi:PhnB protein